MAAVASNREGITRASGVPRAVDCPRASRAAPTALFNRPPHLFSEFHFKHFSSDSVLTCMVTADSRFPMYG